MERSVMRSWPRRQIFARGKLNDRVGWLRVGMACLWAVLLMLANHGSGGGSGSQFLIILADDLGFGDVGAYRSKVTLPTPHLDRLASRDALHGCSYPFGCLHANTIWSADRTLCLAKCPQAGSAQRLQPTLDEPRSPDLGKVSQRSWVSHGHDW